jgi:hypothetical protein
MESSTVKITPFVLVVVTVGNGFVTEEVIPKENIRTVFTTQEEGATKESDAMVTIVYKDGGISNSFKTQSYMANQVKKWFGNITES